MRENNHLTESYWPADTTEPLLRSSLGEVLRKHAALSPNRLALVDGVTDPAQRRRWTYAELVATVEQAGRGLLRHFAPGERIAILAPNSAEWVILQLAINVAGLVLVPLNPAYRAAEIEVILRNSDAAGVFYAPLFRDNPIEETVKALRPRLPLLRLAHRIDALSALGAASDDTTPLPAIDPEQLLQVQFTSGTQGIPKGACLHHVGTLNTARFVAQRAGFPEGGVWLCAMPMFHVGGTVVCEMGTFVSGGTFVIAPGFDPALVLELVESEHVNTTLLVPTMILAVLDHPDFAKRDHSSMKVILTGAAMVSAALVERTKSAFRCDLVILFGQTEVNGVVAQTTPSDGIDDQTSTVGRPLPQAEVRIVGADGRVVPIGERGEICVRGYQTMLGYCRDDDLTEATLEKDGWLHTGDIGTLDSRGYLRIVARLKDMIIRGGMNLYPREIEDVLGAHEAVADVSVVGIPDEKWGEVVAAVVRSADPSTPPHPDELHAYCRARLAAHKAPAVWFYVDRFPLTPSGKVQKFVLQEWIADKKIVAVVWSRGEATDDPRDRQAAPARLAP